MGTLSSISGSGVKSVQRGQTYVYGSATNITISQVNMLKSLLIIDVYSPWGYGGQGCSGKIVNNTTLQFNSYGYWSVDWQVIEYF